MYVKAYKIEPSKVALWDSSVEQLSIPFWVEKGNGGALIVSADNPADNKVYEVVATPFVQDAIRSGRIVEVDAPVAAPEVDKKVTKTKE